MQHTDRHQELPREVGVVGATLLGLGSMLGSGIFVVLALATQVTGPAVLVALGIGAVVATFNALSSAQLAAEHPVSGGTYAYGYRHLHPLAGFAAGWVFLIAKSLSASVAAAGAAAYLLHLLGIVQGPTALLGAGLAVLLTILAASGLRRSTRGNALLVGTTVLVLLAFVVVGAPELPGTDAFQDFWTPPGGEAGIQPVLYASALMFMAYAGYARIATLGEEIHDPKRSIPRAILTTVGITLALYLAVAVVALSAMGAEGFAGTLGATGAPLEEAARSMGTPWLGPLVAVAAVAALLGVLLNLVLGLSRVLLAMARRRDMPSAFASLGRHGRTPARAVVAVGLIVAVLAGTVRIGDAWSLGAFAVLIYYALTNAAALRLPAEHRLYPRWTGWGGLVGTLGLAAFIDPLHLGIGAGLLALGGLWFLAAGRVADRTARGTG